MTGMYFEEFEIGKRYEHHPGRTVTAADNMLFTTLSMNPQPLHLDAKFAGEAQFGQILVNSLFTFATVIGLSVGETTLGTTVGNLGFDETKFPNPVFIGDTIYSSTVIMDKRESKSRPEWGIVTFQHEGHNQRGELICTCLRKGMMILRSSLPEGASATPWHGSHAAAQGESK
jgi:acyl dehydratase